MRNLSRSRKGGPSSGTRYLWLPALLMFACMGAGTLRAAEKDVIDLKDLGLEDLSVPESLQSDPAEAPQADPGGTAVDTAIKEEPNKVSMEFVGVSLNEVLKAFSLQTGMNVIASGGVGAEPMTLYFEDVSVLDAFDQILRAGGLTYERPIGSDIYIVKKQEGEDTVPTITRMYRLRYARVSTSVLARVASAFNAVTPYEAASFGTDSGGGGAGGGGSSQPVGIDLVLQPLLTERGLITVDERTNTLIVTDIPENFPRIEAALAALDIRTPQVLVDAEIIETGLVTVKDAGVEWGTGAQGTLFSFTPASMETRFPFTPDLFGDNRGNANFSDDEVGITMGQISASQAAMVIQALETDTDSKVLARPKVITLDNESAIIRLTTNQAVGFETTVSADAGTSSSEPERETTGVILVVTPQVNENNYITMLVEPSVTQVVPAQVTPPDSSTVVDPKSRGARSLVRIRDGDTLVIGGLIDQSESEIVREVPVLSDIPLIGKAFRKTEKNDSATEIIVFVTPSIMKEDTPRALSSPARRARVMPAVPFHAYSPEGFAPEQEVVNQAAEFEREQDGGQQRPRENVMDNVLRSLE